MEILVLSAECFPLAKAGGLANVVESLSLNMSTSGAKVSVLVPFSDREEYDPDRCEVIHEAHFRLGKLHYDYQVLAPKKKMELDILCLRIPGLLDREEIYGYPDDTERFLSFQIAALNYIMTKDKRPDLIHCHDHQTGLVPFFIEYASDYTELKGTPTLFSLHNSKFQGAFKLDKLRYFPEFDLTKVGLLDWDGLINPMATAIKCAWKVSVVDARYMEGLKANAFGLETLIKKEEAKFFTLFDLEGKPVWAVLEDDLFTKNLV